VLDEQEGRAVALAQLLDVLEQPPADVRSAFLDTPELRLRGVYFALGCLESGG